MRVIPLAVYGVWRLPTTLGRRKLWLRRATLVPLKPLKHGQAS
jgi:hypothetical protein